MKRHISKTITQPLLKIKNLFFGGSYVGGSNSLMNKYFDLARDAKSWSNVPTKDDFNWTLYDIHYRGEIEESGKEFAISLHEGDYVFLDNALLINKLDVRPLHPNHQLLYETILQLHPGSVFEIGVGNGMHLHNLHVLSPRTTFSGIDRSVGQLKFLRESFPNLSAEIRQFDATIPFSGQFSMVDVAFTQTVLMHIKTDRTHLVALANLFNIATKQVVLMENWTNHEFMKDIKYLIEQKMISWKTVHIYYRVSKQDPRTKVMICSKSPLQYPELIDYSVMKKGLERPSVFLRFFRWLRTA